MVDVLVSAQRKIMRGTVSVAQALGGRWNCSFRVLSLDGSYAPAVGAPVAVSWKTNLLYAGWIWSAQERLERGMALKTYDVVCVDFNFACDRRPAGTRAWQNMPAGTIVQDICNTDLAGEGIATTFISAGPTITGTYEIAGYPTVTEALNAVAARAKYYWYVDSLNQMRFFSSATAGYTAPFTAARANCSDISTYRSMEEYANKIILKLPQLMRPEETQQFVGDGATTSFGLAYPVASIPVVKVDATPQTVGIYGVDTGVQWYWSQGGNYISQDSLGTPLTLAQTLAVTYVGLEEITIAATNDTELTNRQAIEGGSGLHVRVIEWREQTNREQAEAKVAALLDTVDELPAVRVYRTNSELEPLLDTLKAGDQQTIDGLQFLIRSVKWSDQSDADVLWLEAEGVRGPLLQDFSAMLKDLAGIDELPVGAPAGQLGGGAAAVNDPPAVSGVSVTHETISIDGTVWFNVSVNYTAPIGSADYFYTAIEAAWVDPITGAWIDGVSRYARIFGESQQGPWVSGPYKGGDGGRRQYRVYSQRWDEIWNENTPDIDIPNVVIYLADREPMANGFDAALIQASSLGVGLTKDAANRPRSAITNSANVLNNGDFELGVLAPWVAADGGGYVQQVTLPGGTQSGQYRYVMGGSATGSRIYYGELLPVHEGDDYELEAYLMAGNATTGSVYIWIQWLDASAAATTATSTPVAVSALTGAYARYAVSGKVPAGSKYIRPTLVSFDLPAATYIVLDSVSLRLVTSVAAGGSIAVTCPASSVAAADGINGESRYTLSATWTPTAPTPQLTALRFTYSDPSLAECARGDVATSEGSWNVGPWPNSASAVVATIRWYALSKDGVQGSLMGSQAVTIAAGILAPPITASGSIAGLVITQPDGPPTKEGISTYRLSATWTPTAPGSRNASYRFTYSASGAAEAPLGNDVATNAGAWNVGPWPRPNADVAATIKAYPVSKDGAVGTVLSTVFVTITAGAAGTLELSQAKPGTANITGDLTLSRGAAAGQIDLTTGGFRASLTTGGVLNKVAIDNTGISIAQGTSGGTLLANAAGIIISKTTGGVVAQTEVNATGVQIKQGVTGGVTTVDSTGVSIGQGNYSVKATAAGITIKQISGGIMTLDASGIVVQMGSSSVTVAAGGVTIVNGILNSPNITVSASDPFDGSSLTLALNTSGLRVSLAATPATYCHMRSDGHRIYRSGRLNYSEFSYSRLSVRDPAADTYYCRMLASTEATVSAGEDLGANRIMMGYLGGYGFLSCSKDYSQINLTGVGSFADMGGGYKVGGNWVVGARQAAVADSTDSSNAAAQLNELLNRLRLHGLIA